jgi:DNA-binding NtrC family response regulator
MITIAVVEDELAPLLKMTGRLAALPRPTVAVRVLPVLCSRTESGRRTVDEQLAATRAAFEIDLNTAGMSVPHFPDVDLALREVDPSTPAGQAKILNYLTDADANVVISDCHMGERLAGYRLLNRARTDSPWKQRHWDLLLVTMLGDIYTQLTRERIVGDGWDPGNIMDMAPIFQRPFHAPDPVFAQSLMSAMEYHARRIETAKSSAFDGIVCASQALRKVFERVRILAAKDLPVLLLGETGTGKEVVAKAIHRLSGRSAQVFHPINCANFPPERADSELFGHVKGAFTDASEFRRGHIGAASNGTLFLDEVDSLSVDVQQKLLRCLGGQEFTRPGEDTPVRVDFRLVSALNKLPRTLIDQGKLRDDFYFRIAAATIEIPPLRHRRDDIIPLAQHFLQRHAREIPRGFTESAIDLLMNHDWMGNGRELCFSIERAVIYHRMGPNITHDNPAFEELRATRPTVVAVNQSPVTMNPVQSSNKDAATPLGATQDIFVHGLKAIPFDTLAESIVSGKLSVAPLTLARLTGNRETVYRAIRHVKLLRSQHFLREHGREPSEEDWKAILPALFGDVAYGTIKNFKVDELKKKVVGRSNESISPDNN